jgi:hypothetical protein
VRCPTLRDLPSPPPGRTGWPWTEASAPTLPPTTPDGQPWPRITIVTPSFNQGAFVEATLRSVLLQGYPDLEYLVLDGGSTDGSVEIIKKYAPWLSYWVSEPDGGQSARGLRRGSGLFATWINSDDMLCRDALVTHASRVGFNPKVVYAGLCPHIDAKDRRRSSATCALTSASAGGAPAAWPASASRGASSCVFARSARPCIARRGS